MTAALLAVGLCDVVTAAGLRPARRAGRIALIAGGVATMMVAAFPQPVRGNGVGHTIAAAIAFTALALWPMMAVRRPSGVPVFSFAFALSATMVTVGLLVWFTLEIHGSHRGLAERGAATAEVLWPLVVAVGARHAPLGRRPRSLAPTRLPRAV
jgi:cytochrome c biogenesis protein CcdA